MLMTFDIFCTSVPWSFCWCVFMGTEHDGGHQRVGGWKSGNSLLLCEVVLSNLALCHVFWLQAVKQLREAEPA